MALGYTGVGPYVGRARGPIQQLKTCVHTIRDTCMEAGGEASGTEVTAGDNGEKQS